MRKSLLHALIGITSLLLVSCSPDAAPRPVSLTRVDPAGGAQAQASSDARPIRVAAASVVSPQETLRNYGDLFAYLARKLGRPVELVQRRTYQETYDLLHFGSVDLGLVCTYVYVRGKAEFGLELLAAPQVNGQANYHSLVIVRADSGIERFSDLAGKRFAFTDSLSTSGRMYPLALLRRNGKDPGTFFAATIYTYSHDNSIKAVLQGVVDGAAVDSLVLEHLLTRSPGLRDKLRVIDRSPAFASPPVVASPGLSPAVRDQVREAILALHQDPEGARLLGAIGVERFTAIADADYQSVREIVAEAGVAP